MRRLLWVEWKDRYFRFGYGDVVGTSEIFSKLYDTSTMGAVRFVSVGHKSADTNSFAYFTYRFING